jgi:hypothetical protein
VQPLTRTAVRALRIARVWRQRIGYEGPWVFAPAREASRAQGKPWGYQAANRALHELAGRCDPEVLWVKGRAFHGFRKFSAGEIHRLTGSERAAADWIGDKDVKVVRKHYLKKRAEEQRGVAQQVDVDSAARVAVVGAPGRADRWRARATHADPPWHAPGLHARLPLRRVQAPVQSERLHGSKQRPDTYLGDGHDSLHMWGAMETWGGILRCPYGSPGDRLWVRESLREWGDGKWEYRADGAPVALDQDDPAVPAMVSWAYHRDSEYCASIHMPRWACRIVLELTEVRAERLWDISVEDVKAEGCTWLAYRCAEEMEPNDPTEYSDLWDMLNAKRGFPWSENWWVWVLSFKRVEQLQAVPA